MDASGSGPPGIKDFSQSAIKKAVRTEVLTHPVTLYPLVVACLSGLAGLMFPCPAAFGVLFGSGFVGLTGIIVNYCFRDEAIANRYIQRITHKALEQKKHLLKKVGDDLKSLVSTKDTKIYVQKGLDQFDKIGVEYESIKGLLESKFSKGELSYGRILGTAEQLYLSVLDNLNTIVEILRSCSILNDYSARKSEGDQFFQEQGKKISALLEQNDQAICKMAETMANLVQLHTTDGFSEVDVETAIKSLHEVAQGLHLYDKRSQTN